MNHLINRERYGSPENLRILAIGGGPQGMTLLRHAVEMTGLESGNCALVIPTARPDAQAHQRSWEAFGGYFDSLGIETELLHKYGTMPSSDELEEKLGKASLVYISGGDTDTMMKIWTANGVDRLLRKRAEEGLVISGISAGAIAPFTWGHSDSLSYRPDTKDNWLYIPVEGLDLLRAGVTPHYDTHPDGKTQTRATEFHGMILNREGPSTHLNFGIDNNAAIQVIGTVVRVVSATPESGVSKITIDESTVGGLLIEKLLAAELIDIDD